MNTEFKKLEEFVQRMNQSNSLNYKTGILAKYKNDEFITRILFYTYNPYFNYGVSSENLKKRKDLITPNGTGHSTIFSLLNDLNERIFTGNAAIALVNRFIADNSNYDYLIYQILDRNLETRATTTLINRVMDNLIPVFDVALAHDANKVKGVNLLDGTWYCSRKLDGVRCITIIENGNVKFFSRNGKQFHTLGAVEKEIKTSGLNNMVLDGEICLMNSDGSDDFQGILKQIQRKDHTIQNPKYWIFDILTIDEFYQKIVSPTFSDRLQDRYINLNSCSKILELLPQIKISDDLSFTELKNKSKDLNWEGLIARRDVPYVSGRSKDMLKIKEFFDSEYIVTGIITGPQRVIVDGKEIEEEMLSAIIINHKGSNVQVGSGFNLDQRRFYYKNPSEIMDCTVTVQYFEETIDQTGKPSLRFPVFKYNYGKTRIL